MAPRVHARDDLRELREEHPLARMMPTLRHLLLDVAEAARHLVAVCAADGELLWVEGPARACVAAEDTMNFAEGALWSEEAAGTNALGTALTIGHPMQVFAAEHFNATVHPVDLLGRPDLRPGERVPPGRGRPHRPLPDDPPPQPRPGHGGGRGGDRGPAPGALAARRAAARPLHPAPRAPRPAAHRSREPQRARRDGPPRRGGWAPPSASPARAASAFCPGARPSSPSRSGWRAATWCGRRPDPARPRRAGSFGCG